MKLIIKNKIILLIHKFILAAILGTTLTIPSSSATEGSLYLLSVGAEPWLHKKGQRDLYGQDAIFIGKAFSAAHPFYNTVHSRVLTEKKATPKNVVASILWMAENIGENDVGIVSFSTHGTFDKKHGFYIDLYSEKAEQTNSRLYGHHLNEALGKIKGQVILFIDSCEAGGIMNPLSKPAKNTTYLLASKSTESSYGQETSITRPHGHFIAAIYEGMRGLADKNKDTIVTLGELCQFIPTHTKKLEKQQTCVFRIKEAHKKISLAKVDKFTLPRIYHKNLTPRNPFGLRDVIIPNNFTDARELAKRTQFSSSSKDPNSQTWNNSRSSKKHKSIDGKWQCRWNDNSEPNAWNQCEAEIKTVADNIFIRVKDGSYIYLITLPKGPSDKILEGAYIDQKNPNNITPFIAKIFSHHRIDGRWNEGRWDFRR